MTITAEGWKNINGTALRSCKCGSWAQHWVNYTGRSWPGECSVNGCSNRATLGAHVTNPKVMGQRIVPMCGSCNGLGGSLTLKGGVNLPSANVAETCGV